MNCKVGDIAVIVSAHAFPENIGGLVRILEPSVESGKWFCEALSSLMARKNSTGAIRRASPGDCGTLSDSCLRPIRDNDQKDQTLDWAPVPTKETA